MTDDAKKLSPSQASAWPAPKGTVRKRRGRPKKKHNPGGKAAELEYALPNGEVFREIKLKLRKDNRTWVEEQAKKHWSSYSQVIDDLIDCVRNGEPVTIKTYTPKYVIRAKKAEIARRERAGDLEKKRKKEEKFFVGASPDDGSEMPEI